MARPFSATNVPDADRNKLQSLVRAASTSQSQALRSKLILKLGDGQTAEQIAADLETTIQTVYKWRKRYLADGIDGLKDSYRSGQPKKLSPEKAAEILRLTVERIPRQATHWSLRLMAEEVGVTVWHVQQVWQAADLQPHRLKTFKISKDKHFAEKVIDVVGLYLDPPDNAVVLSVDEKTQIQALDRTQPMLQLRPGQVERRTHDYKRHGTASLYAAFDIATGKVIGRVTNRHRAKEFIAFLAQINREQANDLDLHLIVDNSSTHKTPEVKAWLEAHPRFKLHFTPTSASWLNAVERWFSTLESRALYRGVFTSVAELRNALRRFIEVHNDEAAKPFRWTKPASVILESVERARQTIINHAN
jgi:transposase